MEQKEQAYAYANADFSNSNELFLEKLFEFYSITDETKILDVGCGDGEIPIEIYKKTKSKITVLDGSSAMLDEFSKKMSANNIDDIKIQKDKEHSTDIQLDDQYTLRMKYPSLNEFIKTNFDNVNDMKVDDTFDLIASCIDQVYSEEESWASEECTKKELTTFVESLNSGQFKKVERFFETMPKLSHTVKVTNPNTEVESEIKIEGLQNFFG